jgi:hypothetical protein
MQIKELTQDKEHTSRNFVFISISGELGWVFVIGTLSNRRRRQYEPRAARL